MLTFSPWGDSERVQAMDQVQLDWWATGAATPYQILCLHLLHTASKLDKAHETPGVSD